MSELQPDGFERFRVALIEDEPAQAVLGGIDAWPEFIQRAVALASPAQSRSGTRWRRRRASTPRRPGWSSPPTQLEAIRQR